MGDNRRNFLKVAGISLVGVSAVPAVESLAGTEAGKFSPDHKAVPGKSWALVINAKKCKEDCTDCMKACHVTHNVPKLENHRHDIKWIWTEEFGHAFPGQEHEMVAEKYAHKQMVVLCNHCEHPPCVRVCPTKATFKREDGIVTMDMHRCIGCRFCMAACPYGSRSFNWFNPRKLTELNPDFPTNPKYPTRMKGVVEKCNFCAERLAVGQMPACVEVCKYGALTFGDMGNPNSKVSQLLKNNFTIRRKPELGTMPHVYYIV